MATPRVVGGVWRGLVLLVLAAMVLAGCGDASAPDDDGGQAGDGDEQVDGADEPGEDAPDAGDDAGGGGTALAGTLTGYITHAGEGTLTLDEIEVLSGEAAAAAREADGEPPVEEGLDIPYLRNPTEEAYEIAVAADVAVQVFDCSAGCELVDWEYRDLVAGTPLPYGGPDAPFTVTVHDGEVVEITEIYLP